MSEPLPTDQLLELLVQMKMILQGTQNSPAGVEQVRAIINTHPQLAYGLIKTMVSLDIVDQDAFQKTLAANLPGQPKPSSTSVAIPPQAPQSYREDSAPYSQASQPPQQPMSYQPQQARPSRFTPNQPPQTSSRSSTSVPYPPERAQPPSAPSSSYANPSLPPAAMNLPEDQKASPRF
ncbi:hypothetical protein FRB99_006923 [Tulasnella sp. 403]|nr:hypothetical protein FRB99_006923 [Tulasnella sp. 403]